MRIKDFFDNLPLSVSQMTVNSGDLQRFRSRNADLLNSIKAAEDRLGSMVAKTPSTELVAFSEAAGEECRLAIRPGANGAINWREGLRCERTGLNNRARVSVGLLQRFCGLTPHSSLYVSEQTTALWKYLKRNYAHAIGSEYLGSKCAPGAELSGIRNEDLTRLTFASESLDCVTSFDCLEHIPAWGDALREIARVLKPGGWTLLTFPFTGKNETVVRASVAEDGSIVHHLPPEYHGDPVNAAGGILCFYHFGHDVLEALRNAGFSEAFAYWFWSSATGSLGGLQPYILARK